jgi:hypothetical protein
METSGPGIGGGPDDGYSSMPDVWHHASRARPVCHGCGSPVQDGDTRAEYKQVTVLFSDVAHSMDIAAAVG